MKMLLLMLSKETFLMTSYFQTRYASDKYFKYFFKINCAWFSIYQNQALNFNFDL